MNIAFCDGMLLQVVLHGGKATVLSKREIGADTINFYNYFARYCLSPEEPLLKLLNCADDEAIEIISGQPLVKQFCWDSSSSCTDALTQRNQATAKEALTYTRNLTQQAFSELDAVFSEFHDTKGPDGSKVVFMPKQVITTFALLNNKIVQVYSVKDLYDYLSIDFYYANYASYAMIRVLEPGLEVLDQKYDIVIPEGFKHGNAYVPEIMEEVGRKVIHLLEEIYGRKASPEIWALNNFKEFEVWYDANKKELEANARKKGPKGKTAAKIAA